MQQDLARPKRCKPPAPQNRKHVSPCCTSPSHPPIEPKFGGMGHRALSAMWFGLANLADAPNLGSNGRATESPIEPLVEAGWVAKRCRICMENPKRRFELWRQMGKWTMWCFLSPYVWACEEPQSKEGLPEEQGRGWGGEEERQAVIPEPPLQNGQPINLDKTGRNSKVA